MNPSEKTISRIENAASKIVNKIKGKFETDLTDQVQIARKMIRTAGMFEFRANLLKDRGLPSDIIDKFEKGQTIPEIKAFYWDNEDFKGFWVSDLQMTEDNLDTLILASCEEFITGK